MVTTSITAAPISTVNITGLRNNMRGFSLTKDCPKASFTWSRWNNIFLSDLMMILFLIIAKRLSCALYIEGGTGSGRAMRRLCDYTRRRALAVMSAALTHPDYATLVDPLFRFAGKRVAAF